MTTTIVEESVAGDRLWATVIEWAAWIGLTIVSIVVVLATGYLVRQAVMWGQAWRIDREDRRRRVAQRQAARRWGPTVLVLALALVSSSLSSSIVAATNYALIVNGDTPGDSTWTSGGLTRDEYGDRCHTHRENVAIASAALERRGWTVMVVATRGELATALHTIAVSGVDTLLVYTTGHATEHGLWLAASYITPHHFAERFRDIPYHQLYYIGDQCYSGAVKDAIQFLPRVYGAASSVDAHHLSQCARYIRPRWRTFDETGDLAMLTAPRGQQ